MKIWLGLVLIVLVLFEVLFFENIFSQIVYLWTIKSISVSLYYVFVSFIGFLSVTLFFFIKETIYFILFSIFLIITYSLELLYKNINNMGFSLNDLPIALDGLITDSEAIKISLIVLMLLIIIIFIIRSFVYKNTLYISSKWVFLIFILALLFSFSIVYKTSGKTQTRPTGIKMINTFVYHFSNNFKI